MLRRALINCCLIVVISSYIDQSLADDKQQESKNIWSAARDYYKKNPIPPPVIYRGRTAIGPYNNARLTYDFPIETSYVQLQRVPNLLELPQLLMQYQKTRGSHQQEVFGSRLSEPIRAYIANDYVYCDSLNNLTNQSQQSFPHVAKSGFNQYPSHVGLYNKSDNTYVCGSTYLNDNYLLTAASCVKNLNADDLIAQFNEWNNKTSSRTFQNTETPKRGIESISIFPGYSDASLNHDLAILELKPQTEFHSAAPFIIPSCQFNDRRSLHAKTCWLPHRNVSITETVDLEELTFHQETKVSLNNKQVKLLINDQICQDHTGISSFSSIVPDVLCSSDAIARQSDVKSVNSGLSLDIGSGIYCYEGGFRSLVSMVTSRNIHTKSHPQIPGFLDLNFYKPWIIDVTTGHFR